MQQRSLMLKERITQSQNKIKEMSVFSNSSNLVIRKREAAANELMLSIFNPTYHKRKVDEDEYLIPVKDFEKEVEERSGKKKLYFDVVFNMNTVHRVIVSTSDLVFSSFNQDDHKITKELINLGELKLFQKLKQVYSSERDTISLLEIENLANFKLVASDSLASNITSTDPGFQLIVGLP